jgi:peptide/nickel transport system substrate-binding protein
LQEQLPVIPVTWYRQQVACSKRLAGVSLDPLERSYRLTDMEWHA